MMISSVRNPKIQELRALQSRARRRREIGTFVVEGLRLAEETVNSDWDLRAVFYTRDVAENAKELLNSLKKRKIPAEEVSEAVMKAITDTKTPQGILLEVSQKDLPLPLKPSLVLILDGISDPGNLGTLLRSAAAAGADCVLLAPGCADAFAPKVLRGGMGAHFQMPLRTMDWPAISSFCRQNDLTVFLAEARNGLPYDHMDLTQRLAFIIGAEAYGPSQHAKQLNPTIITIPMAGQMESLNAAIAGSLLLFEALNQRRDKAVTV